MPVQIKHLSDDEILSLARKVLDDKFILASTSEAEILYKITDKQKMEVQLCTNAVLMIRLLSQGLEKETGVAWSPTKVKAAAELWKNAQPEKGFEPAPFAFKSDSVWSFKKLSFDPVQGEFPAWGEFLIRCSSPEDAMAAIASAYKREHVGRQILYFHDGSTGKSGKSTATDVLFEPMGPGLGALNSDDLKGNDPHLAESFVGKRVVICHENKNQHIIMNGFVRKGTSGDRMRINPKGRPAYTTALYFRLVVVANDPPEITSELANTSRLLPIYVAPAKNTNDPQWRNRLRAELPYFLKACFDVYEKKCPNHGDIILSPETLEQIEECTKSLDLAAKRIIDRYLERDISETLTADQMESAVFSPAGITDSKEKGKIYKLLNSKYSVIKDREFRDGQKVTVYHGIKLKTSLPTKGLPSEIQEPRNLRLSLR